MKKLLTIPAVLLLGLTACSSDADAPPATVPPVSMPEVTMPEVTMPEVSVPELTMPEVTAPDPSMPEADLPEMTGAQESIPQLTLSDLDDAGSSLDAEAAEKFAGEVTDLQAAAANFREVAADYSPGGDGPAVATAGEELAAALSALHQGLINDPDTSNSTMMVAVNLSSIITPTNNVYVCKYDEDCSAAIDKVIAALDEAESKISIAL